ncbi:DUF4129 domain-containing protein [Nocardia sp. NPDC051990]|uniref:DUF4129 domain-containing protein n=1 Tax=Nocardia sp. NPDC051990 TaxID=3155285 RepID=UPI0034199919
MIVLITLLVCAAIALRGHIPGAGDSGDHRTVPSAISVVLMPVLLTVSMVILIAGVIASQHRLPLAMPEVDRDAERGPGLLGRTGLLVLGALAVVSLIIAAASAIFFVGFGGRGAPAPSAAPHETTIHTSHAAVTGPATPDSAPTPHLTGTALLVAGLAAIALVGAALVGLIVVAVAGQRKPRTVPVPVPPAAPTVVGSLARAAEMGLAAMNMPGQDPREAIIACYVAMERGLSFDRAAAPLASDTPMEVLARAFERGALHDASARELVALFEEARFSPHSMLEWQRMRAEQLLRIVLADLQGEMI